MGACVSIRKRHEGNPSRKSKKKVAHHSTTTATTNNNNNRKRRRAMKKRVSSCFCDRSKSGPFPDRSFSTPTFQGSTEEAWFDSTTRFDSDGEEDFQSVQDDILSQNGFERYHVGKHSHEVSCDRNSLSDLGRHSGEGKHPVFLHEMSSAGGENTGKQDGLLDNCGILANNCLPCLTTSTVDSIERRKSLVGSPPSAKKKAASRHSFKGRDGLLSPRWIERRNLLQTMQHIILSASMCSCPHVKLSILLDSWTFLQ
uniref:Uncharacterized protein n=1 Tax=Opuntia streptacantha TaxID=393608 RepID=A0A7C9CW31_OPUST